MKIFEIIDEELNISIGVLLYNERERTFIIELQKNLDEWTAPLLFTSFVKRNIIDTTDACKELTCSRQNLSYMIKQGFLEPLKENVKGNLYSKGDVLKNTW